MSNWVANAALAMAVLGCGHLLAAAVFVNRFPKDLKQPRLPSTAIPGIALLKPLCGAEPGLFENLASFFRQDYRGPVTIIIGVQHPDDSAIAVVDELRRAFPDVIPKLVIAARIHGPNRKISNLVGMAADIDQPIVIVSDSDIGVEPDYLVRIACTLNEDNIDAVTCLYYGVADAAPCPSMVALGINAHYLPNVVMGLALGRARPCFGATIALRRETLEAIGGFAAFSEYLADDHEIGQALRARGGKIAVARFAVAHRCTHRHWQDLWSQELRWARTTRSTYPAEYIGSMIMHPFAWSLLGLLAGGGASALAVAVAALGCRLVVLRQVEQAFGLPPHPYSLIPLRELVSTAVFLASFLGRGVRWRGHRQQIRPSGRLSEHIT